MRQREVWVFCDCPGCANEANVDEVDGMKLRAECAIASLENGKLIDKTKYDEDGEPYMKD